MTRKNLRARVRKRAGKRYEYCHLPDKFHPLPFEVEHVIPKQHSGPSTLANFAWACFACNKHKGPNLMALIPNQGNGFGCSIPENRSGTAISAGRAPFFWAEPLVAGPLSMFYP